MRTVTRLTAEWTLANNETGNAEFPSEKDISKPSFEQFRLHINETITKSIESLPAEERKRPVKPESSTTEEEEEEKEEKP